MIVALSLALLRKLAPYLIGGALVIAALTATYFYIKGKGYAECKSEWDASVLEFRKRVDDAAGRALDERVPDPFDRER